jgi:hypothetical protein
VHPSPEPFSAFRKLFLYFAVLLAPMPNQPIGAPPLLGCQGLLIAASVLLPTAEDVTRYADWDHQVPISFKSETTLQKKW